MLITHCSPSLQQVEDLLCSMLFSRLSIYRHGTQEVSCLSVILLSEDVVKPFQTYLLSPSGNIFTHLCSALQFKWMFESTGSPPTTSLGKTWKNSHLCCNQLVSFCQNTLNILFTYSMTSLPNLLQTISPVPTLGVIPMLMHMHAHESQLHFVAIMFLVEPKYNLRNLLSTILVKLFSEFW